MSAEEASMLTQKLAKEAIFGVKIMKRCTPGNEGVTCTAKRRNVYT